MKKTIAVYLADELSEDQDQRFLQTLKAVEDKPRALEDILEYDGAFSIFTEWNSPGIEFPERFPDRPEAARDAIVLVTSDINSVTEVVRHVAKEIGLHIVGYGIPLLTE